jgi:hypothetical protein
MVYRLLLGMALVGCASGALAEGRAIAIRAGALGLGVEYTHELTDRIAVRGGLNGSSLGFNDDRSGIHYDFDLVWDSLSVGIDFHPLKTAFRISGGILRNDNRLNAVSEPTTDIVVGDTTYTPEEVGTLRGRVSFDHTSPFVGVGWDWSRKKRRHFGMSFDLGVLDQGKPDVSLTGSGTLLGDPAFQADIEAERAQLADSLSGLDLVPYMSVGFVIRF